MHKLQVQSSMHFYKMLHPCSHHTDQDTERFLHPSSLPPAIFLAVILKGNLPFLPPMTRFVLYTKESFCVHIYTPLNLATFTQHMLRRPLSHLQ